MIAEKNVGHYLHNKRNSSHFVLQFNFSFKFLLLKLLNLGNASLQADLHDKREQFWNGSSESFRWNRLFEFFKHTYKKVNDWSS